MARKKFSSQGLSLSDLTQQAHNNLNTIKQEELLNKPGIYKEKRLQEIQDIKTTIYNKHLKNKSNHPYYSDTSSRMAMEDLNRMNQSNIQNMNMINTMYMNDMLK